MTNIDTMIPAISIGATSALIAFGEMSIQNTMHTETGKDISLVKETEAMPALLSS